MSQKALTAKQISEKLSTPMLFIEDEIDILVRGENGEYGLLRKLDNDKYIANVVVLDLGEFEEASSQYTEHLDEFCGLITTYLQNHKETLENFPCLSPKKDPAFHCLVVDNAHGLAASFRDKQVVTQQVPERYPDLRKRIYTGRYCKQHE